MVFDQRSMTSSVAIDWLVQLQLDRIRNTVACLQYLPTIVPCDTTLGTPPPPSLPQYLLGRGLGADFRGAAQLAARSSASAPLAALELLHQLPVPRIREPEGYGRLGLIDNWRVR